jgi:hypothetical protein
MISSIDQFVVEDHVCDAPGTFPAVILIGRLHQNGNHVLLL